MATSAPAAERQPAVDALQLRAPLSFADVELATNLVMLGVYERLDTTIAVELFAWSYRRSMDKSSGHFGALGRARSVRSRYREHWSRIRDVVSMGRALDEAGRSVRSTRRGFAAFGSHEPRVATSRALQLCSIPALYRQDRGVDRPRTVDVEILGYLHHVVFKSTRERGRTHQILLVGYFCSQLTFFPSRALGWRYASWRSSVSRRANACDPAGPNHIRQIEFRQSVSPSHCVHPHAGGDDQSLSEGMPVPSRAPPGSKVTLAQEHPRRSGATSTCLAHRTREILGRVHRVDGWTPDV